MSANMTEQEAPIGKDQIQAVDSAEKSAATLSTLAENTLGELLQLFKLLADETRLRIIHYLLQRQELNVGTLCRLLNQSQPAVSHHLALLRVNGVIEMRRDGKHNFYHLVPRKFRDVLDILFAVTPNQAKKFRFEDRLLTYTCDSE